MTARRRIGVFGGTFDPIHIGHLAPVEDVAHTLALDRVIFVPNRQPPHKRDQQVTKSADRVAMVELAIEDNLLFEMSRVEVERDGPSYSLDTLREMRQSLGEDTDLYFLVGGDSLAELHTWQEPEALLDEFHVAVMERPPKTSIDWDDLKGRFPSIEKSVSVVHVVQLEVSSSDIRDRVKAGKPIRYYVSESVRIYIEERGLYEGRQVRG